MHSFEGPGTVESRSFRDFSRFSYGAPGFRLRGSEFHGLRCGVVGICLAIQVVVLEAVPCLQWKARVTVLLELYIALATNITCLIPKS